MLERMFLITAELSVSAAVLFLLILAVRRAVGKKMTRNMACCLWILVLLRLVIPFSPEVSLLSGAQSWLQENGYFAAAEDQKQYHEAEKSIAYPDAERSNGDENIAMRQPPGLDTSPDGTVISEGTQAQGNRQLALHTLPVIWVMGAAVLLVRRGLAYGLFLMKIKKDVHLAELVPAALQYEAACRQLQLDRSAPEIICSNYPGTPVLVGIIHPRIILPQSFFRKGLPEGVLEASLRHELMHYKRRDILYKWFTELVCILHWFNPLVWQVGKYVSRDCELACDEALCRGKTEQERHQYGMTLLYMASVISECGTDRYESLCTAMGKEGEKLKERLKNIKEYRGRSKKERMLSGVMSVLLCTAVLILGACSFSAEPENAQTLKENSGVVDHTEPRYYDSIDEAVSAVLLKQLSSDYSTGEANGEGHVILGIEELEDRSKKDVFLMTMVGSYGFENGYFTKVGGSGVIPAVVTLREEKNGLALVSTWNPMDGADYMNSLEERFPPKLREKAKDETAYREELQKQERAYASTYLQKIGRTAEIVENVEKEPLYLYFAALEKAEKLPEWHFPYWVGTREELEDGKRIIYETARQITGEQSGTYTFRRSAEDGTVLSEVQMRIENGEQIWAVGDLDDITGLSELLDRAEKMEAVK